jgi:hypothetical protein
LDVPTNPSTDRAEVWSPLPCRCHPARDGVVRFFPLRSPNAARWNATRRPSPGGSKRTGHGSSEWPGVVCKGRSKTVARGGRGNFVALLDNDFRSLTRDGMIPLGRKESRSVYGHGTMDRHSTSGTG